MIPATESRRVLQENTGNHWNMEEVFQPEFVRIFSGGFLSTSSAFRQEPAANHRKKFRKFPAETLLPQYDWNYREPAVFGPVCSIWVMEILNFSK
jgi:hypothetical protein